MALYPVLNGGSGALELHSFVIEGAYLVVVTLVLAHLAGQDDWTRRVMGTVAAWTTAPAGEAEAGLSDILNHVASVVQAPRVLLVWQAADQPHPTLALWTHERLHCTLDPPTAFEPLVAEPLRDCDFVCSDAAQPDPRCVWGAEPVWRWRGSPLDDGLLTAFAIRAVIAVGLQSASLRGWLFVLDKPAATSTTSSWPGSWRARWQASSSTPRRPPAQGSRAGPRTARSLATYTMGPSVARRGRDPPGNDSPSTPE
jgi:hypothetical protein